MKKKLMFMKLVYYMNLFCELVLCVYLFIKFFYEVDFYGFTGWVYESSLHTLYQSMQTLESDNLDCN